MARPVSVVDGKDSEIIPLLLKMHAPEVPNPIILDCTYNTGKMWKGLNVKPLRFDINSSLDVDVVGDFNRLPFQSNSIDVIVFDPPHLPTNAASANSSLIYKTRYGITANDDLREGDNISPLFAPFLKEAKRVLRSHGIILAKLIDLIHNHKYQWQHVDFINTVKNLDLTPCDVVIKSDPVSANLQSSKWVNILHFRRKHTYWIVVRKGPCERKITNVA